MYRIDKDFDYKFRVIKNKLGITNPYILEEVKTKILKEKIQELLEKDIFILSSQFFKTIHRQLLDKIYFFAGSYRKVNISKTEEFLPKYELVFSDYHDIVEKVELAIEQSTFPQQNKITTNQKTKKIADLITTLWKIHPFREGNTAAILVFACKYVEKLFGYQIYNDIMDNFYEFYCILFVSLIEDIHFTDEIGMIIDREQQLFLFLKTIISKREQEIYIYE